MFSIFFLGMFAQATQQAATTSHKAIAFTKTAPLRDLVAHLSPDKADAIPFEKEVKNRLNIEKWENTNKNARPAKIQSINGTRKSRGPIKGFTGQSGTGFIPPDTDGDVNDEYFVQMVNSKYNVYLKDGTKILGPLDLGTLWSQLPGGPWGSSGDPIVLYDEEYDRWVLTQFAPRNNYQENYEVFAISETSDPTGAYFLYAFEFDNVFNDYPKMGVWHDAYYATYNMFERIDNSFSFVGASITAVEREKMVVGDPNAQMIVTPGFSQGYIPGYYATMPADVDGENFPESSTPCPVMYINNDQEIELWDFTPDWNDPNNSTLVKQNPNIIVSSFTATPNDGGSDDGFISQPNTSQKLDGMGVMIMNRLAYRKFDDHESMVVNHSVLVAPDGGGSFDRSGLRWYEFRRDNDFWELYQEGTYAPDDGVNRWMGSIAMNGIGDIAIGYSVSNATDVKPSIRYTGRRVNDPLGEMTVEEVEVKSGSSTQNHYRWGDYSCMNVDPSNDTTFWYTTEYGGWSTWISAFDFSPILSATAEAGENGFICINDQFLTSGSGDNVLSVNWSSDGDGFFAPSNQFNSTYIRGSQDIANGGCTLTMTTTGYDGLTASDDLYLNIVPWVDAGGDDAILATESYQLQAQGTETGIIEWISSGNGTFSDEHALQPIYTPGSQDIANAQVELIMKISITEPCVDEQEDSMILDIIVGLEDLDETEKFSVYPNPSNDVFSINMEGLSPEETVTLIISNSIGNEVYREVISANSTSYKKALNMSNFKTGVYFASLVLNDKTRTLKLLKR